MGAPALRLKGSAIGIAEGQALTVVNWRQAAQQLAFALAFQLLGGFVTGIKAAIGSKGLGNGIVTGDAFGLAVEQIVGQPQPGKVPLDGLGIGRGRPFLVGIIKAQQKPATHFARE